MKQTSLILRIFLTIVLLALVFVGIALTVITAGGRLGALIDLPTTGGFVLICVPILFLSGRARDFVRAIRIAFGLEADDSERKAAEKSCSFLCAVVSLSAAFMFVINIIGMLNNLCDTESIGANLAVALLPVCHALVIDLLLLTIKARVKK